LPSKQWGHRKPAEEDGNLVISGKGTWARNVDVRWASYSAGERWRWERISARQSWIWFVCGWQVNLCDPLVTHKPYLSTLEMLHDKALYKIHVYFTFNLLTVLSLIPYWI